MIKGHTIYLDESGIACLTDKSSENFVLSGVILDNDEDNQLSGYFNFIKRKYLLPEEVSFHSYDLFRNKGSEYYLTDGDAKKLSISIAEFIAISPMEIVVVYFNKQELREHLLMKDNSYFSGSKDRKRDKDIGYEASATEVFLSFAKFLRIKNSPGRVIMESRKNSDYTVLKTYLRCHDQKAFGAKKLVKNAESFSEKVSSITFENKKGLSGGLQIADIISFVANTSLKGKFTKKDDLRGLSTIWNAIKLKLDKKEIKKIQDSRFPYLLSTARVNKITDFNRRED